MSSDLDELDTQRDYEQIVQLQILEGLGELRRPASGQFLSAVACGLHLAIGAFSLFVALSLGAHLFNPFVMQVLQATVYTFGFIFAIIARTELFTEHTTLAVIPVLDGQASLSELGQLWSLVLIGNLIGGTIFAVFGYHAGLALNIIDPHTFVTVATGYIHLSMTGIFLGAVLAGWLMGLLAWSLTSVGDTISRIVVIFLVTFLIGFSHLPHCIAANAEVVAGMVAGANISVLEWARFEAIATLGNIVGGTVFVGLLNYSFAVRGADERDVYIESDSEEDSDSDTDSVTDE
jgi:formate/nitrite transporter FocA (FNT family)